MAYHIIDVMDNGQLIVDSVDFQGNMCEASLAALKEGLKGIGIETTSMTESKKTSMLANPNRNRVRS